MPDELDVFVVAIPPVVSADAIADDFFSVRLLILTPENMFISFLRVTFP